MTISGERTEQLDIFYHVTGFTSDFLSFIDAGTYSVLSQSPSVVLCVSIEWQPLFVSLTFSDNTSLFLARQWNCGIIHGIN